MSNFIIFRFILCTTTFIGINSCNGQTKPANPKSHVTATGQAKSTSANFTEGKDYTEFVRARVLDKIGFPEPVEAISLLIPKSWKHEGTIMWNQPGTACAGNNMNIKASSPDGKFTFEMLPSLILAYAPGQGQSNQLQGNHCSYGQPLEAAAYFKNVFVRNELGNPEVISVKANPGGLSAIQEGNEKNRQEMMSYGASGVNFYPSAIHAQVKWRNGEEGIILCGVNISETIVPNIYNGSSSKVYTTTVFERVVFKYPASESDKAARMLSVIMSSIRTNSAWKKTVDNFWLGVRQRSNVAHIGTIKMIDEQTRQIGNRAIAKGQQNLANMDANMRSWEAYQQSGDRIHTNFVKAIREVETYRDETGRIELSSGYNHAWSRSDGGSFIMSDNPNFNPSSVLQDQRWKEMKKVN